MKLNLESDANRVRKYIEQRIADYSLYENFGPGEDDDPIKLITLGFYASQGGSMYLVFDTRPEAEVDGQWTVHLNNEVNTLPFPDWFAACEAIRSGKTVSATMHDGTTCTLDDSTGYDVVNAVFGEMLLAVISEFSADGKLKKLPLTPDASIVVEELDGLYFA